MRLGFGVHLPIHGAYSYDSALKVALLAEKLGFKSLWVGDHFFLPAETYERIGGDPNRPDKLDAWITLAAIATQTTKITLGTRVSPIPFYLPGRLAKIVTTLDIISGGRAILGAGAGWHKEEAISYGVGWGKLQDRIEKMLEGLDVIVALWKSDKASYEGKYYRVRDAPLFPKPVQRPHPPIWFGGSSPGILEALAKIGEGWLPTTDMPLKSFEESASKIRELAEKNQRDPSEITLAPALSVSVNAEWKSEQWVGKVEKFIKNGARHILLDFSQTHVPPRKAHEFLKTFTEGVIPSL